jgi:ribosomal protein S13
MRKSLPERERAIAAVEAVMLRGECRPYVILRKVDCVGSYRAIASYIRIVRERWRASNADVSPPPQRGRAKSVPCELSESELQALRDKILAQPIEGQTAEEHAAWLAELKADQDLREEYRVHGEIDPMTDLYLEWEDPIRILRGVRSVRSLRDEGQDVTREIYGAVSPHKGQSGEK